MTTPFTRALVTPDGERSFLIFGYPQAPKISLNREKLDSVKFLALDLYGGPERLEVARLAYESGVQTAIGDVVWPDHPALKFSIATNSGPLSVKTSQAWTFGSMPADYSPSRGNCDHDERPYPVHALDARETATHSAACGRRSMPRERAMPSVPACCSC